MPSTDIGGQTVSLGRSPTAIRVGVERRPVLSENGINDGPGGFDYILSHKQHGITAHGVGKQAFVGQELAAEVEVHGREFHRHGNHFRPGLFNLGAKVYGEIGAKAETEVVILVGKTAEWRLLELH